MATTVTLDPTPIRNADGTFTITGRVSSTAGLGHVAIGESIEDGPTRSYGSAVVGGDGSFSYEDRLSGLKRGSFVATAYITDGTTVQSGVAPYTFYADGHETTVTGTGEPATSVRFDRDGSSTVSVLNSGLTLDATASETFQNAAEPDNVFVFDPGHGAGIVRQFVGNGDDHDTLSLKGSDFGDSVAAVLAHTYQFRGVGTVIVDPASGDTVRLGNVSKAELAVNKGDITFHP